LLVTDGKGRNTQYIINVTTTEINTCKKIFEFGQRGYFFLYRQLLTRERTLLFTQSKIFTSAMEKQIAGKRSMECKQNN
jgi:hypothetical protein